MRAEQNVTPKSSGPSLNTLEAKLNNILGRLVDHRDKLQMAYELTPLSPTKDSKGMDSGTNITSLNQIAGEIQSYLIDCEELASKIKG